MDPITHALVGGLVAKTVKAPKRRFWILMFLGEIPDIDVVFSGLGPWAFWLQHRGITHSLFGIAAQTLFFAWAFSRWDKGPFRERLLQYSIPICLHVFCDYLTSYGVPLLSPFSFQDFSGDLVPAITLIPLFFMAFGLLHMNRKKKEGWLAVQPFWAAWMIYLFISASGKAYAFRLAAPADGSVAIVSGRVNPLRWTAVTRMGSSYTYQPYSINVLNGEKTIQPVLAVTNEDNAFIEASLKSPEVRRLVEKTRWPMAREIPTKNGMDVEWGSVIFSARGDVRGFLRVQMSRDGSIQKIERIFEFWRPDKL